MFYRSDPTVLIAVKALSEFLVANGDLVFNDLSEALETVPCWFAKSVGVTVIQNFQFVFHSPLPFPLKQLHADIFLPQTPVGDQDRCARSWLRNFCCVQQTHKFDRTHFYSLIGSQEMIQAACRIGEGERVYVTWRLRPALRVCSVQMKNSSFRHMLVTQQKCLRLLSGLVFSDWRRSRRSHFEIFPRKSNCVRPDVSVRQQCNMNRVTF